MENPADLSEDDKVQGRDFIQASLTAGCAGIFSGSPCCGPGLNAGSLNLKSCTSL
jgi:hypothetical protein